MNPIFNYQSLDVHLSRPTRTLFVSFRSPFMDWETLFEFESILAWSTNKVEIKSIVLQSDQEKFGLGLNTEYLQTMPVEKVKQYTAKLQTITQAIPCMAQTVICDLGLGSENVGAELALACDIRIVEQDGYISFNHAFLGLVPCSGALSTLGQLIGHAHAKNWVMSCENIQSERLISSGFCFHSYHKGQRNQKLNHLLNSIAKQADVARVQSKLGLSENYREHGERLNEFATKLANAALNSEDWKNVEIQESMPAKHFATAVKLSLVKNDPV